jgi:hypothetical protein
MGERQLRSRSLATVAEATLRHSESYHGSTELECDVAENETPGNKENNAQIEILNR